MLTSFGGRLGVINAWLQRGEAGTLWNRGEFVGERIAPSDCRFVVIGGGVDSLLLPHGLMQGLYLEP